MDGDGTMDNVFGNNCDIIASFASGSDAVRRHEEAVAEAQQMLFAAGPQAASEADLQMVGSGGNFPLAQPPKLPYLIRRPLPLLACQQSIIHWQWQDSASSMSTEVQVTQNSGKSYKYCTCNATC